MNALAKIRPWFLARQRREKILAAIFLIAIALVWLGLLVDRARAFSLQVRIVHSEAKTQDMYLDRAAEDQTRYEQAIAALSPETFPKLDEVRARVDALVRKYGFKPNITFAPNPQKHDRIIIQPITVSIDAADYNRLSEFQHELAAAMPTVHLKQYTMRPAGRSTEQFTARLEREAIEFNR
jgi:hypothetical protein